MRRTTRLQVPLILCTFSAAFGLLGCEDDDPLETTSTTTTGTGGAGGGIGGTGGLITGGAGGTGGSTGGTGGAAMCSSPDANVAQNNNDQCQQEASDYTPGADDTWAACISDDGTYHPFDVNISTIARIAAFEKISTLLGWGEGKSPSPDDFINARVEYSVDQGLESRVSRREDEHYPAAAIKCQDMTPAELAMNVDRCVGPAQIQPLLNAAFQDGTDGKDPVLNAARVEAGLLWFLYMSVYKEATTCTSTQVDCDSHFAYYTGGELPDMGLGLSRYVRTRSEQANDFVWNGILAVRCWRDLDNPAGAAMDTALRDKARAQLDRGLLRGMAAIVRQRALALPCDPAWETVRILGKVLDREATARSAAKAQIMRDEIAKGKAGINVTAFVNALDSVFPCP
ncbi:MAG: hypothetical protein IPK82_06745 [Polyangiaceae bacterium]|nr:hypothetical protein [Polyangiaceae bacterium]